jgi:hypothetical protein
VRPQRRGEGSGRQVRSAARTEAGPALGHPGPAARAERSERSTRRRSLVVLEVRAKVLDPLGQGAPDRREPAEAEDHDHDDEDDDEVIRLERAHTAIL